MAKHTILVVEDNERINRLFVKQLNSSGYDCQGVFSVQSAIEEMDSNGKPDVIVLDLELGERSGMEVLDYLKEDPDSRPKTFIVSANAFSSRYSMKGYSVEHVLLKPVSPRSLAALIQYELRISSIRSSNNSSDNS